MKRKMKMIKTGLVALALSATVTVFGQTQTPPGPLSDLGPKDNHVLNTAKQRGELFDPAIANFDNELINSILFYNPAQANSFNLKASKIEDEVNNRGLNFTKYIWSESTDGISYTVITGQNTSTLTQSGLTPGYHYYKVEGLVNPDGVDESLLCSPLSEVFAVYVLPQLSVTVSGTTTNSNNAFVFCESEANTSSPADGQKKVSLTSSVTFNGYSGVPNVDAFEKKYRWYAIKKGASGYADFSNLSKDPTLATGANAILLGENVSLNAIDPQIDAYGVYKVFVEVEYTIKDRNYGLGTDNPENRNRSYVIYRGIAQFGGQDLEITVTPTPGKPHITIEAVQD